MIRSRAVFAMMNWRGTDGSGRDIHDSPSTHSFSYSSPVHWSVYDFRSRVPTTVDRSDTARAIEGTDRAASSDAPTEYE